MGLKNSKVIKNKVLDNTNVCNLKEIIVSEDFEVENGVLGLERDIYLSIVKFLGSSMVRKVLLCLFYYFYCDSILGLVKNHMNE
jgi:hypothetical protein